MESDSTPSNWQDFVAQKQRECEQKIPREWVLSGGILAARPSRLLEYDLPRRSGLLSESELDITENYTASQLLVKLASGRVSSLDVTMAFCKRAAIAQQVVSIS
jgi:amidase